MLDQVKNTTLVELDGGFDESAEWIDLLPGEGARLPDPAEGRYNLVCYDISTCADPSSDPGYEIVRVIEMDGDRIRVERGQEDTAAAAHNTPGRRYGLLLCLTAKMIRDIDAALEQFGHTERGYFSGDEIPAGNIDGVNRIFTASRAPVAGTLTVRKNGLGQTAGNDFLSDGEQITMIEAPLPGDTIIITYKY